MNGSEGGTSSAFFKTKSKFSNLMDNRRFFVLLLLFWAGWEGLGASGKGGERLYEYHVFSNCIP